MLNVILAFLVLLSPLQGAFAGIVAPSEHHTATHQMDPGHGGHIAPNHSDETAHECDRCLDNSCCDGPICGIGQCSSCMPSLVSPSSDRELPPAGALHALSEQTPNRSSPFLLFRPPRA